jgi:hypothetical protein
MGWSLRIIGGYDLTFYGLAFWQVRHLALLVAIPAFNLYTWYFGCIILITQCTSQFFNGLTGVTGPYAQDNILSIEENPKRLKLYNLGTHLVKNMVTVDGKPAALSADNKGGWGGLIAAYLPFTA